MKVFGLDCTEAWNVIMEAERKKHNCRVGRVYAAPKYTHTVTITGDMLEDQLDRSYKELNDSLSKSRWILF